VVRSTRVETEDQSSPADEGGNQKEGARLVSLGRLNQRGSGPEVQVARLVRYTRTEPKRGGGATIPGSPALVILDSVVTMKLGTDSYNLRSAMLKSLMKKTPCSLSQKVSRSQKQGLEGQTRAQTQGDLEKKTINKVICTVSYS
jgi:hypothetical protein